MKVFKVLGAWKSELVMSAVLRHLVISSKWPVPTNRFDAVPMRPCLWAVLLVASILASGDRMANKFDSREEGDAAITKVYT